jgi:hypothetical protein
MIEILGSYEMFNTSPVFSLSDEMFNTSLDFSLSDEVNEVLIDMLKEGKFNEAYALFKSHYRESEKPEWSSLERTDEELRELFVEMYAETL